ncbi:hypothetical protein [Anatilimnocola floriformis]|uniref:hypothetical protein n=1 Tax=Anatilimnocola floriformis TaxID=2948575 RepID=UPI0020C23650|nr:hypothetical protein [Anatilimnocola floriformis]
MSDFNPYVEWLGLPADLADPNHYQVLGLPNFEADAGRITVAADKAMSRVRGFRPGPNAKAWSKLLDELLLAKGRLLDPERKQEYDTDLRETAGASGSAPKAEAAPIAPASSAASGATAAWDPRFPPGMGPNGGKSTPKKEAPPAAPVPEPTRSEPTRAPEKVRTPEPAPIQASLAAPTPIAPSAPEASPAAAWPTQPAQPMAAQPIVAQPMPAQPMMAQPAYPQQAAPLAQPMYGYQPQPGYQQPGYPQPQPAYPQQPQYGQPQPGYAQPGYAPQQYGGVPGYPQQPGYPQPYGQPQPMPYGAPQYPQPSYGMPSAPPPPPPAAEGLDALFGPAKRKPSPLDALGLGSSPQPSYAPTAHAGYGDPNAGMGMNPMAPMPMPGADPMAPLGPMSPMSPLAMSGEEKQPRIMGFAAGQPVGDIPRGKAAAPGNSAFDAPLGNALSMAPMSGASVSPVRYESAPKKKDPTLIIICAGAALLVVGGLIFALANSKQDPDELAQNQTPVVQPTPPTDTKPKLTPTPPKPPEPAKPKLPVEVPKPIDLNPMVTPPMPKPEVMPTDPRPEMKPEVMEPKPKPEIEFKPPDKNADPKPEMMTPMPMKPAEPPMEKMSAGDAKALTFALTKARQALKDRNFSEADAQLAAAKPLAKGQDPFTKFERLNLMNEYVKQFDKEIKALFADDAFTTGAELTLGASTRVIVVAKTPQMLTIRLNATNKTYTPSSLPDGLAMALVDVRLPPTDRVTKVIKGAWLATSKADTPENQEKAKQFFTEAAQEGLFEISDLPLVMTDKYDFKE